MLGLQTAPPATTCRSGSQARPLERQAVLGRAALSSPAWPHQAAVPDSDSFRQSSTLTPCPPTRVSNLNSSSGCLTLRGRGRCTGEGLLPPLYICGIPHMQSLTDWEKGRGRAARECWASKDTTRKREKTTHRDLPGGPVVENPPSNAGDRGLIPGRGARIPRAANYRAHTPWSPRTLTRERKPACHN